MKWLIALFLSGSVCFSQNITNTFYGQPLFAGQVMSAVPSGGTSYTNIPTIGNWLLNDGSGTTAADSSGSGLTGYLTNSPTWGSTYLTFLGTSSQSVGIPSSSSLNILNVTNTVYAFVRFTNSASPAQFIYSKADSSQGWGIYSGSGYLKALLLPSAGTLASTSTHNDGNWHFLCIVFITDDTVAANNKITMYIDGTNDSGTFTSPSTAYSFSGVNAQIAARSTGGYFTGDIKDVGFINRGITAGEALELYNYYLTH